MNGFEVYKLYLAIKLHFTSDSYNYFTFNGKTRTTLQSFEKRRDKYFFKKLATKFNQDELAESLDDSAHRSSGQAVPAHYERRVGRGNHEQ